ncbi:MAG TPA: peptidoglycan-binding domain-containing protein [Chthoniobacterales bacterium]|nr:peptidoglycan-binding domain-containing protein [Chthoniobacterales bacterium]
MKTLLLSALALTIAAAPIFGEDQDQPKQPKKQTPPQRQVNQVPKSYTPRVQQQLNARTQATLQNKPNVNRTYTPKTYTPNVQNRTRTYTPPNQDAAVNANNKLNNPNWNRNRYRTNPNVVTNQTPNTNVQANTTVRNHDWRNRQNNTTNTFTYQQARSRFNHQHHDRSWWRSHYSRISLFAGGYYFWNDGYWYPAYGYDPGYSTYAYDEPIYGYNDLDPGQVIANVQAALQEQGYYRDAVDGLIGPNTRAALSNFQRDRGLPITAAIDGPTLQALGLY